MGTKAPRMNNSLPIIENESFRMQNANGNMPKVTARKATKKCFIANEGKDQTNIQERKSEPPGFVMRRTIPSSPGFSPASAPPIHPRSPTETKGPLHPPTDASGVHSTSRLHPYVLRSRGASA